MAALWQQFHSIMQTQGSPLLISLFVIFLHAPGKRQTIPCSPAGTQNSTMNAGGIHDTPCKTCCSAHTLAAGLQLMVYRAKGANQETGRHASLTVLEPGSEDRQVLFDCTNPKYKVLFDWESVQDITCRFIATCTAIRWVVL